MYREFHCTISEVYGLEGSLSDHMVGMIDDLEDAEVQMMMM